VKRATAWKYIRPRDGPAAELGTSLAADEVLPAEGAARPHLIANGCDQCSLLAMAGDAQNLENREYFIAVAATVMRRILVDHARAQSAEMRRWA
jgi:ECF sigma factor